MSTEQKDTITVELPIKADGDLVYVTSEWAASRKNWRKIAAGEGGGATEGDKALAPAVVAWIERDEWKPLDVPAVDRTIKATLRNGAVVTYTVWGVTPSPVRPEQHTWVSSEDGMHDHAILTLPDAPKEGEDIVAWEYVDEAAVDLAALADKIAAAVNELREAIG